MSKSQIDVEYGDLSYSKGLIQKVWNNKKLLCVSVAAIGILFITLIVAVCGIAVFIKGFQANFNANADMIVATNHISFRQLEQLAETDSPLQVLAVIHHPLNASVELGSVVQLTCQFDQPVECIWTRRSFITDINGRYKYMTEETMPNNDCSIEIQSFKEMDKGDWKCIGLAKNELSVESKVAWLTVKTPNVTSSKGSTGNKDVGSSKNHIDDQILQLIEEPKPQTVQIGSTVEMKCVFNKAANCAWTRGGEHVEIEGRYTYRNQHLPKYDCSFVIYNVKLIDLSDWMCSSMADSNSPGVASQPAKLISTSD
ncbi:hypothetical protein CHUAL_013287 [Chamberlinius hualienensis]